MKQASVLIENLEHLPEVAAGKWDWRITVWTEPDGPRAVELVSGSLILAESIGQNMKREAERLSA